jgi:hypothetical protein
VRGQDLAGAGELVLERALQAGGLAEIEGQAGGRDADLAVVFGSGRRARGMMTGAWP